MRSDMLLTFSEMADSSTDLPRVPRANEKRPDPLHPGIWTSRITGKALGRGSHWLGKSCPCGTNISFDIHAMQTPERCYALCVDLSSALEPGSIASVSESYGTLHQGASDGEVVSSKIS